MKKLWLANDLNIFKPRLVDDVDDFLEGETVRLSITCYMLLAIIYRGITHPHIEI
jgi:hypothetical protein